MKRSYRSVGGVLVLGLLLLLGAAAAQAQDQGRQAGPGPRARAPLRGQGLPAGEVERLFDGYVVMQAQDALKLTDAQFPPFVAKLRILQEVRRRNRQEHRRFVAELARALATAPVPENELHDVLRRMRDQQLKGADEEQKAYEGIDQVLDPVQQARFRVFEDTVERRKFDLVLRARGRAQER